MCVKDASNESSMVLDILNMIGFRLRAKVTCIFDMLGIRGNKVAPYQD